MMTIGEISAPEEHEPPRRSIGRCDRVMREVRLALAETQKLMRYGMAYPRSGESITVATGSIERVIAHPLEVARVAGETAFRSASRSFAASRAAKGQVVADAAFAQFAPVPLGDLVKFSCCIAHWGSGVAWEATGIYDHLMQKIAATGRPQSGCRNIAEVRARYARLDTVFDVVRREGHLRGQRQLKPRLRREYDGIEIHIGPDAEPIFGDRGNHRLAMAKVLELRTVPAMLGFVHVAALGALAGYRDGVARPARSPDTALWEWESDARAEREWSAEDPRAAA